MNCKILISLCIVLAFQHIHAQSKNKALNDKLEELKGLSLKKSIINLNTNRFKEYVRSAPRDYSFIVMFTAMQPARRCAICQHVYEEYTVVANSYKFASSPNDKLFFGMVDFDEGSDIFQMLRLNTAPVIMHFPAKGKPKSSDSMDFERTGVHAEAIAKWIQDRTDVQIRVFRPPNYSGVIMIILISTLAGSFLYVRRNNLEFLKNKTMWGATAMFVCFAMISGQMWNQIRGPPLFHRTKSGPVYINSSSHGQFVLESYIVAGLNATVVIGMLMMIEAAGGVKGSKESRQNQTMDMNKRRIQSVVGLILVCVFFSLLMSIFRSKTQGYPYSFLFK